MIFSNFGIWNFDNLIFWDIENIMFWIYMFVILVEQALVFLLVRGVRAEPSLPEKKNELHWGAEQAFVLLLEEEQHVFICFIVKRIKSIKNIKMKVSELKVYTQL